MAVTAFAFAALFLVLQISEESTGKGSAINVSGSLRMQSYVLALTVARTASESESLRDKEIRQAVSEFERRLNLSGLTNAIPGDKENKLKQSYDRIASDFSTKIKPLALDVITHPNQSHEFLNQIPAFVSLVDKFVLELEKDLENKTAYIHEGLVGFMILALVLFFVVRYYLRKALFDPLADLASLASSVRNGDFSKSSDYKKRNEIGTLAGSMNYMIRDLSRMYSSLEEQVKEKTADLDRQNKAINLLYGLKNELSGDLNRQVLERALAFCSENLDARFTTLYLREENGRALRQVAYFSRDNGDPTELGNFFENQKISFSQYNFFKRKIANEDCTVVLVPASVGSTHLSFAVEFCGEAPAHVDRELLKSIAREFALAINSSEKDVESRRLILFEERSTIARELHDSIAQSLSFSRIQITRLDSALKSHQSQEEILSILGELKLGVLTAYQQLRSVLTTFRLKPKSPDLRENILSSLDEFKERSGIKYSFDIHIQSFELDANSQIHLLQILREALTNIEKHARADHVDVSLKPTGTDSYKLEVSDNGLGFDLKRKEGHYGLEIMSERAKVLGGELKLEARKPHGTSVILTFSSNKKQIENEQRI